MSLTRFTSLCPAACIISPKSRIGLPARTFLQCSGPLKFSSSSFFRSDHLRNSAVRSLATLTAVCEHNWATHSDMPAGIPRSRVRGCLEAQACFTNSEGDHGIPNKSSKAVSQTGGSFGTTSGTPPEGLFGTSSGLGKRGGTAGIGRPAGSRGMGLPRA